MRTCTDCLELKPIEAFTPIKGTPYYHGRCRPCRAARARAEAAARTPDPAKLERLRRRRAARLAPPGTKVCRECGETKPESAFLPVKGTPYLYLKCRVCRAKRAKERYYKSPEIHEAEVARARKNGRARRLRRRLQAAAAVDG